MSTQRDAGSRYWLDMQVRQIIERVPEGEIIVSSGISPSASYHIGHFPEVLMAEALTWGLRRAGREVRHVHVVDNMDPLRKRYDFLPEAYEQYVGWPICLIPNPHGEGSYADYFFEEFRQYFEPMGIAPDKVIKSYEDLYLSGEMTVQIERVLERLDDVRRIFADFGREVASDWTPIQVLSESGQFVNARPDTWDKTTRTIEGVDYTAGRAKLNWRLDWPARWAVLGVNVEPFNKHEHGAAGGSYDTGQAFARRIFDIEPPIPGARYGNVHLEDDPQKMSSSKGNLITPAEVLRMMPPSILRYFVVRSKPGKNLHFYPGKRLANLIDEYKDIAAHLERGEYHDFADAYRFATREDDRLTDVPFMHLVNTYQAARRDQAHAYELLGRGGYEVDTDVLYDELRYIDYWLEHFAPEEVKFELQDTLPPVDLSADERAFLSAVADYIENQKTLDGETVHTKIHELKDEHSLRPIQAFQALYQVLLGQKSGPKAGWFLTTIDREWLIDRLRLQA